MPSIAEVRAKYPQYNDLSDDQLAQGLHKKFYSDLPYEQFTAKIGLAQKSEDYPGKGGFVDRVKDVRDAVAESPALRQLALGARNVGEAAAFIPSLVTDVARAPVNAALRAAGSDTQIPGLNEAVTNLGAPTPETEGERYASDLQRGVVSAISGAGAAERVASVATGTTKAVAQTMAARPGLQAVAGGSGGLSAGFERENDGLSVQLQKVGIPAEWADRTAELLAGVVGGVGGGLVADAAGSVARSVGRFGKGLVDPFFRAGQEGIAGSTLANQADDPIAAASRLAQADDVVPGSKQTTGTASKDRGLMAVEKAKAAQNPSEFSARRSEQNVARQNTLDDVAGTEADVVAARAARDTETGQMREAALSQGGAAPIQTVTQKIDDILASPVGERKVVKAALAEFRDQLDGKTEPARLYEIRKDIGDAMAGKLGGEKSVYALARKQLIEVRESLDDAIEQGAPGFKAYLKRYSDSSKPIDNMEVLQEIQRRAGLAAPDITTGRDVLSQSKFRQAITRAEQSGDLKNLTAQQREALAAVQADLDLGAGMTQALKTPGSDTFQNASVANLISAARGKATDVHPLVQSILRPLRWVYKLPDDQIDQLLTQAMLDPKLAAKLLQKANAKNAGQVSASLRQVVQQKAVASTVGASTSQAAGRPEDRRRPIQSPSAP